MKDFASFYKEELRRLGLVEGVSEKGVKFLSEISEPGFFSRLFGLDPRVVGLVLEMPHQNDDSFEGSFRVKAAINSSVWALSEAVRKFCKVECEISISFLLTFFDVKVQ